MAAKAENGGDRPEEVPEEVIEDTKTGSDIASEVEEKLDISSKDGSSVEDTTKKSTQSSAEQTAKNQKQEEEIPEPDKTVLKEQFSLFSKFGDKTADGKTIKLSQSDKWFKQAKVIDGKKVTTTDTGIAFRKISKNSQKLSFSDWLKYLDEIATAKKLPVNGIKQKLVDCGKPGLSGATSISKNAAVDRLTDTSRYGGTHKKRFDSTGKGRGKEGREDAKSDGYVKGYKEKGTYQK